MSNFENRKLEPLTIEEVAKHNTINDGWMIVKGWVLDVTNFFVLHPGGSSILMDYLGKDATAVLNDKSIHMHSVSAYTLLKKFRIGYIESMVTPEKIEIAKKETKNPSDYGIDLTKGLMWQCMFLGDAYHTFIENTYLVPESGTLRYFDNELFEYFSKGKWWTVPLFFVPITLFFLISAITNGVGLVQMILYIVGGVLIWMFFEYMLHRYVFHYPTTSTLGHAIHFMLHGYHHICPLDPLRLTFPTIPALALSFMMYSVIAQFFSYAVTMAIMTGAACGYISYDCGHYMMHHSAALNFWKYFKSMKRHHLYHHYKNENSNFGISSMLYDYVFNSFDQDYLKGKNRD